MRQCLIILLVFLKASLFAQDIPVYRDSLGRFTIDIPKGWIIDKKPIRGPIALSVRLSKTDEGGIIPSYVVNIIQNTNTTFEEFYKAYCRPIDAPSEDRVLISEDNYLINGINYKWILTKSKSFDLLRNLTYCATRTEIFIKYLLAQTCLAL